MFISTTISSNMLNKTQNIPEHNFSIPYDFSAGRNICVKIFPQYTSGNYLMASAFERTDRPNTFILTIPENVTEFTKSVDIYSMLFYGTIRYRPIYEVKLKFDLVKNIITFTPISVSIWSNSEPLTRIVDGEVTVPVLINIFTILE